MLTNELLEFISAQYETGTPLADIEHMLLTEGGWEPADVNEAFRSLGYIAEQAPPDAPSVSSSPTLPSQPVEPQVSEVVEEIIPPSSVEIQQPSSVSAVGLSEEPVPPTPPSPQEPVQVVPPPPSFEIPPVETPVSPLQADMGVMTPPLPPDVGHEDFLGLFSEQGGMPELTLADTEKESLPAVEQTPEESPAPSGPQSASEWSLNYMLAKAAAGKPLHIPKDDETPENPPPTPPPLPPISEEELSEPPQGLSPEQRIIAEEAVARAGKLDPEAWKEKDVKATSTAELWLARGGKPLPAMMPIAPSAAVQTATPPPESHEGGKMVKGGSHRSIFRSLLIAFSIIVFLSLSAAAAYYVISSRGPKAVDILNQAMTRIFGAPAVSYAGEVHADLDFSGLENTIGDGTGRLRFALGSQGQLAESTRGFGDGSHRFHLAGELHSGTFEWQTDLEGEIRMIDRALYFHAITIPKSDQVDPDLLRTYWIKLNLAEIAQELGLGGKNGEPYGDFGASDVENTFATVFLRQMPLRIAKEIGQENLDGVDVYHYALFIDPTAGGEFLRTFYKNITGKDLNMTEDEKVRFVDALQKIKGEIWIGTADGLPKKITLSGDLDDELFGVRVKGTLGLALAPKVLPAPATVDTPTPTLSLDELRERMDEYRQTQSLRASDDASVEDVATIVQALDAYKTKLGRYPDQLTQLLAQEMVSTTTLSRDLSQYTYYAYTADGVLDRAHRCSARAKTCGFYHLGVNLHDITNPALSKDADRKGDISGDDALGCGREKSLACYDVTAPVVTPPPTPPPPASKKKP